MYCGMPKGTSRAEEMTNSEPEPLAVVESGQLMSWLVENFMK